MMTSGSRRMMAESMTRPGGVSAHAEDSLRTELFEETSGRRNPKRKG